MIEVVETEVFQRWMERLKDSMAKARILARLRRATMGNLGDWKPVGGGVARCGSITAPATGSISPGVASC